jgi:putative transposase
MPGRLRIVLPVTPLHLIKRENNQQACFYAEGDYLIYLDGLKEFAEQCECSVQAYVLMTNHVHLLRTPHNIYSVGTMMKRLGQCYVQHLNHTYRRSCTLWEAISIMSYAGRGLCVACYRYIELNPVRASLVEYQAEYRWSSFRANAQGEKSTLLTPHD